MKTRKDRDSVHALQYWTLGRMLAGTLTVVALTLAMGLVAASWSSAAWAPVDATLRLESVGFDWWTDWSLILRANVAIVAMLVLGGLSLGAFTLAHLAWNGYLLGHGLAMMWRADPHWVGLVCRYAPIEIVALALAAAASLRLVVVVADGVMTRRRMDLRGIGAALVVAVAALGISAGVEADVAEAVRTGLVQGAGR